jgi:CPA2 family monovalent cation:H+ antiporter-2
MATPLLEAGIIFAAVAVGGALAERLGQSVIPAYILAGLLIGPNAPEVAGVSLALVESSEFVKLLAELGIVFLLFFIGLEFNLERLLASRSQVFRAGGIDLAINGTVGVVLGLALGFTPLGALFVGGVVYISSSAVITKSLIDLGWIADPESEPILGTLVFEDVVVAVYLAVMAALVGDAAGGSTGPALVGDLGAALSIPGPVLRLALAGAIIVALVVLAFYGTPVLERLLDVTST